MSNITILTAEISVPNSEYAITVFQEGLKMKKRLETNKSLIFENSGIIIRCQIEEEVSIHISNLQIGVSLSLFNHLRKTLDAKHISYEIISSETENNNHLDIHNRKHNSLIGITVL